MADDNIMSLIQNLFVDDNNSLMTSQMNTLGGQLSNDSKFNNFMNENLDRNLPADFNQQSNAKQSLDNEINASKKLLIKQLNSQMGNSNNSNNNNNNNHNNYSLLSVNAAQQQSPQNATSFYNDLSMNPVMRNLTMKDQNELDLSDSLLFASKMFPLLNGTSDAQLSKANYDLLNNNTTPTNQNHASQQSTGIGKNNNHSPANVEQRASNMIKDLPCSPLPDCVFKQSPQSNLLTPSTQTGTTLNTTVGSNKPISAQNNLYNNFNLISNSNSSFHQPQQQQQQQHSNNTLASNKSNMMVNNLTMNSPISNNSNNNLSHSGAASTVSSFADIILGCDENNAGQSLINNYGLSNAVQRAAAAIQQQQQQQQQFTNDSCTSPDSFIYSEEDRFESQVRSLANEIHSTIQLHMNGLHMRREGLLQQLEHIKKIYLEVLRKKKGDSNGTNQSKQLDKFMSPSIIFNKPDSALYKAISQLGFINTPAFGPFCTATGNGLEFAVPGINLTFTVETRNCFNDELLVGRESVNIEILALFNDNSASSFGTPDGGLELNSSSSKKSLLGYTSKSIIPHTFFDHNNGKYTITYNIPLLKTIPQELVVKINVNGLPINDSPIRVPVQTQKRQNWKLATTFGSEGNTIGSLCRPWGVAIVRMPSQLLMSHQNNSLINQQVNEQLISIETISLNNASNNFNQNQSNSTLNSFPTSSLDNSKQSSAEQHYLIGIADRSNNRIQMIDYNSKTQQTSVINVFGSGPGTRAGMFDRPAGICINLGLGHIIVADKDNHRIQVFSLTGRYLFKFGEKGNRIGQFCCPWTVDSCASTHQIAVSDTRNRRIQIFTPYGQYVNHFSLLLDSPRGVSFLPDKRLVVSDFNKHRILIFDKFICNPNSNSKDGMEISSQGFTNLNSPKIIGFGEGSAWGEFLRPQGVAVSGNVIFCADSRNNRICLYNMLTQTFEYLSEDLNLDRPADLSVIDENILVIIDFGNNRLQILQR